MSRGQILQMARRHEVFLALPKTVAVTALTGALVLSKLIFQASEKGAVPEASAGEFLLLQGIILLGFAGLLLKSETGRRCRAWEAGLPVTTYALWRSHHLALIGAGLFIVVVTGAVFALFNAILSSAADLQLLSWSSLVKLLVQPSLLVLTVSGLVAIRRLDLADLADDPDWRRVRTIYLLGMAALLVVLSYLPPVVGIIPVVIVALMTRRARAQLPAVLESTPGGTDSGVSRDETTGIAPKENISASSRTLNFAIMRVLFKWPSTWILGLPFIVLFGFVLGGFVPGSDDGGFGDNTMRVISYYLIVYLLLAFGGHFLDNLWRVDHLPIKRRRLLLWLVMPNIVALMLGYGGSAVLLDRYQKNTEQILFVSEEENYGLKVPVEFFALAASDEVPPIVAPDGAEIEPFSTPVYTFLPWRLYKPYHTPFGTDSGFIAWQIHRAVLAVYGTDISPDEITERYLRTGADGVVTVVAGGLTLQADYPQIQPSYRGPVFPILVGMSISLYLLSFGVIFGFFGPGVTLKKGRIAFWGAMGGLFLLHIGVYAVLIAGWSKDWILTGVVLGLARSARDAGPGFQGAVWLGSLALTWLSWSWAEWRFRGVEAPRGSN